ncbi:MAG: hypothetical protein PVG98_15675 [Chromatiales bacterium]|jgi:hypothetical protein
MNATMKEAAATALAMATAVPLLAVAETGQATGVSEIEQRRLFEPTDAERAAERQGRIYIYDGLSDRDIQRAMQHHFDRIENMMFIRTIKTDTEGRFKRDPDTGHVEVMDDGC